MCYSIKYIIIFVICYVIIYYNHNIIVIAERRERSEQSEANNRVLFEIPRYLYIYTVWPEILAGNLFWRIGGFENNPPIFHPPKTSQCDVIIIAKS